MNPTTTPSSTRVADKSARRGRSHWEHGRLVDGDNPEPPASPWSRVIGLLMMVLLFDLLLGWGEAPVPGHTPDSREALDAILTAASEDPGRSVLVIGDSVMAGDVMAGRVDDWTEQRVVDHMRAELGQGSSLGVHQIALDGLLPVDLEHILARLDQLDPGAEVELVLELNLRYFSAAYAEQDTCSRELLCELVPNLRPQGTPVARLWRALLADVAWIDDLLHAHAPVHRRRGRLGEPMRLDALEGLAIARVTEQAGEAERAGEAENSEASDLREEEGAGRVLEHFRSAALTPEHAQVAALERSLARLASRGRRALIFLTPLEDQFADQAAPEPELGGLHSEIGAMVHAHADPGLRFVDFDHPLFVSALFIDHCHLWPEGNRLLALNLLHELSAPMRTRPPAAAMVMPEDFDQSLVTRVDRGYAEGAAWQALFNNPDGIDVSRDGGWIVVADTRNHMLRQLRGHMRVVEPLAGAALERGRKDGDARGGARLWRPRHPTILGEVVFFIDGRRRERLRVVDSTVGWVDTLRWKGPRCTSMRRLRARKGQLYMLCDDGRILALAVEGGGHPRGLARELLPAPVPAENGSFGRGPGPAYRFEVAPEGQLLFSDPSQRIWTASIRADQTGLKGPPRLAFANTSKELLPSQLRLTFPFDFDEIGLAKITDLRWVERYGGLLVADEHPLHPKKPNKILERELNERVHLRFFDLETRQVYPWVKAIPHGEAYGMWNEKSRSAVSYYHRGSLALAQDDASLVWVERSRSRLFRLADGLLGLVKFGNRNSKHARVKLYDAIGNVAPDQALAAYSPDRFFDARFEPFEREGPYLGLMVGSSLTTLVDRFGNYSMGRRLELELQRELGYRDNIRFDLFQRTAPSASLETEVGMIDQLVSAGVGLDLILVEVNDHNGRFFRDSKGPALMFEQLSRLEQLAGLSDAMVVLFDNSGQDANGHDGLRASTPAVHELLEAGRKLGFLVLEPSDRMLRDLLVESPWGTQPWGKQEHHGAPYAIDRTAEVLSFMLYPALRESLRGRIPGRLRARTERGEQGARLGTVFEALDLDREGLLEVRPAYLQQRYEDGHVRLFVDLSGFADEDKRAAGLERIAAAVLVSALEGEAYGMLADEVTVTLVEFDNYDEYGEGVLESAAPRWGEHFEAEGLMQFLARVAGR